MTSPALRAESEQHPAEARQDETIVPTPDLPAATNEVTAMYGSVSYEWKIKSAHRRPPWEADDLD